VNTLVLDIETYSIADADLYLEPVAAPSNYRDQAKITAYQVEKRAEMLSRCALDPDLCRIVAIGSYDDEIEVRTVMDEDDERDALVEIWERIGIGGKQAVLIGFNLLSFDLPVLIRRTQYLGLPVWPINLDRYRTPHIDLMERLSFNGKTRAHSLSFYCRRFGIDVPDEHSGAAVAALVEAGRWEEVASHCRADVLKTRALATRLGYLQYVAEAV
jgi:predicted PolB exonuclease-like 3'-5' exonuclease